MIGDKLLFALIASAVTLVQVNRKQNEPVELPDKHEYHIFFDVGHVLVKSSIPHAVWHIGPKSISNYLWQEQRFAGRSALQGRLFAYMDQITGLPTHDSITSCDRVLPGIMYNWITGTETSANLLDTLRTHPDKDTFFKSDAERDLVLASANIFEPEVYVGIHREISEMVQLLKDCLEKYPEQVYILSNWDESYGLLKTKFPEIFKNIPDDHIIFSYEVGCAKPDKEIYDFAARTAGLDCDKDEDRTKCILIDDGKENIDGIESWGGNGVYHVDPRTTRQELAERLSN